jgi:hypothetical protein
MKRRLSSLIQAGVFVLLLVGVLYSISYACTFVAFVRQPGESNFPLARYDSTMYHESRTAGSDATNSGWSMCWQLGDEMPPWAFNTQRFSTNSVHTRPYNADSTWYKQTACSWPANDKALVAMVHARQLGTSQDIPDPHPFLYDNSDSRHHGIFGKTHAFIHNGKFSIQAYRDSVGPGCAGLDLFFARQYAGLDPSVTRHNVDTEWLMMMIMKYVLIQDNCYWDDGTAQHLPTRALPWAGATPEEWALQRVAQIFPDGVTRFWDQSTQSINGVLTDGQQLYALGRSDNGGVHKVWFHDSFADATGTCREIESDFPETAVPFDSLGAAHYGHTVRLSGVPSDTPPLHGNAMSSTLLRDPSELRVNPAAFADGDQTAPAIATNPEDGSWVAVWMSDGAVMGRWYNPMGLAENNPFMISEADPIHPQRDPAVAFSATGSQFTVVWVRESSDHQNIFAATYQWQDLTHTFTQASAPASVYPYTTNVHLGKPSIAYDEGNGHAIVWTLSNPPYTSTSVIAAAWSSSNNMIHYGTASRPTDITCSSPDIAWVGGDLEAYAIAYGVSPGGVAGCVFMGGLQVVGNMTLPNQTTGHDPTVAACADGSHFYVAYNDGSVKIAACQTDAQNTDFDVLNTATGEAGVSGRPDIATRRFTPEDLTYFTCYALTSGGQQDIRAAHGVADGATPQEPVAVNAWTTNNQTAPVIAIASNYPGNAHNGVSFYAGHTNADPAQRFFEARRLILWETYGEDESTANSGIAGQFRGIKATDNSLHLLSDRERILNLDWLFASHVSVNTTISDPVCVIPGGGVIVDPGVTLTISPGVTVLAEAGTQLTVQGHLVANGCTFGQANPTEPSPWWKGIRVNSAGTAILNGCTISGADTAIYAFKVGSLLANQCTIQQNQVGVFVYGNPVSLTNCAISQNSGDGISLLATINTTVSTCAISNNGGNGALLYNAYAVFDHNTFSANSYVGLESFGSSPVLFCNTFDNNLSGEMYLANGSYPALWNTNGEGGGNNIIKNDTQALISMADSYPLVDKGGNNFYAGRTSFFMVDKSAKPPKHMISGNFWSPSPAANTFSPQDPTLWIWSPTASVSTCGAIKGQMSGSAAILFDQGFNAEMSGNLSTAQADYSQTITSYPDSDWAQFAAARLYDCHRGSGTDLSALQSYYQNLASTYPEDTSLVKQATNLAIRLWVEEHQYESAYGAYETIMANPPSTLDSLYAALDYAVTAIRQSLDDTTRSNLDSPRPTVAMAAVRNLMMALHAAMPETPMANHEDYRAIPTEVTLTQNYPNPFNATTTLQYYLPSAGPVRLTIYNLIGQKVATLVDAPQSMGFHNANWNGVNAASGVYICELQAAGRTLTQKMMLLK